jgi:hypothetical protein
VIDLWRYDFLTKISRCIAARVVSWFYWMRTARHLAASDTAVIARDGAQIEGDSIRCPYHGWRFGSDGIYDDIPYFD